MGTRYIFTVLTHFACVFVFIRIFFYVAPCFLTDFANSGVTLISTLLIGWYTFGFTKEKWLSEVVQPDGKAVLITGCDSGFGKALAIRLDSKGFHVFASCLFPSGPGALELRNRCSERLQVLELDVTKDRSVQIAAEFVKENLGTSELWALINNAGIHKGFSVEFTQFQDFLDCMEVNTYGPVRVTKAFLPLLRQSKGRIINLTSLAGRKVFPYFTAYTMSKFAIAGFNDCLRQELDVWGVSVVSIEPEIFKTGLTDQKEVDKRLQKTFEELDESIKSDYGEDYIKNFEKIQRTFTGLATPEIQICIDDIESAVSLKHPDPVYRPRRNFFYRSFLYIYEVSPIPLQDISIKWAFYLFRFL